MQESGPTEPLTGLLTPEQRPLLRAWRGDFLAPQLATLTDARFSDPDWLFERKLDGARVIAGREGGEPVLWSRNHKRVDASYPEVVEALAAQPDRFVVDGEVVAFDGDRTSFARLQNRMHLSSPREARRTGVAVYYYLFDLIAIGGVDVTRLPLRVRKRLLEVWVHLVDLDCGVEFTDIPEPDVEQLLEDAVQPFGGRADVMQLLAPTGPVYQAGTLAGNPVAVAAGLANLRAADASVYEALDRNAARLGELLGSALTAEGVPHQVSFAGNLVSVFFSESPVANYEQAQGQQAWRFPAFFNAFLERGVYPPPSAFECWFVNAAMDEAAFERIAEAAQSMTLDTVYFLTGEDSKDE